MRRGSPTRSAGWCRWLAATAALTTFVATPAAGRDAAFSAAVNAQVRAATGVAGEVGVDVVDLESGESLYGYHRDTARVVASNTKLVTAAAALDRLGPGAFFETDLAVRGSLAGGVLTGDLAVVGGGDPNLSGRHYAGDSFGAFREWAAALRRQGIAEVDGDLVLVHGLFDDVRVHPDWPRDQLAKWYEAPVEALSFNDNCVLVSVAPQGRAGLPALVRLLPGLDLFTVQSTARTVADGRGHGVAVGRRDGSGVLTVAGGVRRGAVPEEQWVAVPDPLRYFGSALRAALAEEGVVHRGAVVDAERLPKDGAAGGWRRLHTHRSDLLSTLDVVNKRSQNFYAESVAKLLGARLCGEGSWAAATEVMRETLDRAGVPRAEYTLADGSGMSRGNRMAPSHLTRLLAWSFRQPWGRELVASLPYSGEEGLSWETRLAEPPYRGNVMAKTGTLAGVSTLSGYAKARSGRVYAFSILMNGARTTWQARAAQDRIVRAVIDHG